MATLVLTAVGTAIGGPVGGAIGALLGRSADRALLGGQSRREGPRLTELAVQTSSYGTQIPRLFGTMRVAGTVIWSTDLIETRGTSAAGKGQPTTNTYSYSASFAVALSARPIVAVRRIWADGNLLRGAAGDFKVTTGFRLHSGDEAQAADPLIASALGLDHAPAHRGIAYAVFEDLQLAEYGNHIPSLTFEVVADAATPTAGQIAQAVAPELSGDVAMPIGGFAASGGSVRAVLETLGTASGAWFAAQGGGIAMADQPQGLTSIADAGAATDTRGVRRRRAIAAIDTVPRSMNVQHYDPARDFQTGIQRARRPGAGDRDETLALPAAIGADDAKALAAAALRRCAMARTRRTVTLGPAGLDIRPGDGITLIGEAGAWRVVEAAMERHVVTLSLTPLVEAVPGGAAPADSGRVLATPDTAVGRTRLVIAELPALDDTPLDTPRIGVIAAGEGAGWRRAALLLSLDDGASWTSMGATAAAGVVGRLVTLPRREATAMLIDTVDAVEVVLATPDAVLADATVDRLVDGANLALMGKELVQFARAEPLGGGRWRLHGLVRGRRGTEAWIGTQAIGDGFALIEPAATRLLDLPLTALGTNARVMASGVGDADPVEAAIRIDGGSVLPLSPCHLRAERQVDGGVDVHWTRRSRAGWRWLDGVDAPLAEEAERYRVTVTAATGDTMTAEVIASPWRIDPAILRRGPAHVTIAQIGRAGPSLPAALTISATGEV